MSERALAFVEEWVSDHVDAQDADGDIEARAKTLASQCLADASKEGIPASEIGEAIDDLPDFILGAIEEAEDRDEHAHRQESDKEAAELVDPEAIENAEEDALEDETTTRSSDTRNSGSCSNDAVNCS
jgi:secreted protein with Ig-like and vWFA domain